MIPSQVLSLIDSWLINDSYVFDYRGYWLDTEVLIIKRYNEDEFVVDYSKSTVKDGPFTKDQMIELMTKDLLIVRPFGSLNINYREDRTNGCDMGCWKVGNTHSFNCRNSKK